MGATSRHQTPPTTAPVTSDGLRRNQLALEALIAAAGAAGVISFNSRSGAVSLLTADVITALGFTLAGNPGKVVTVNAGATALELQTPAASGGYSVTSVAASYTETATSGEKLVKVTASGQTVTLPTAVGNTAKLTYKLMVAGTLTIDGAGTETIDGGLTAVLLSQYEAVTVFSDNANWQVG